MQELSPSNTWVSGIQLKSPDLAKAPLPAKLSYPKDPIFSSLFSRGL